MPTLDQLVEIAKREAGMELLQDPGLLRLLSAIAGGASEQEVRRIEGELLASTDNTPGPGDPEPEE